MTQIDFYILAEKSPRDINHMVCRLCEKALSQEMKVLINSKSVAQAQQLDDLLWTFKADSFIAHYNQLIETGQYEAGFKPSESAFNFTYPILISNPERISKEQSHRQYSQLLINLRDETPSFYQQFERVAELVDKDPQSKEIARNRYRFYRHQGDTLNKYNL